MRKSHRMEREAMADYYRTNREAILKLAPKVPWPVEPFDEVSDITPEQWEFMLARLNAPDR